MHPSYLHLYSSLVEIKCSHQTTQKSPSWRKPQNQRELSVAWHQQLVGFQTLDNFVHFLRGMFDCTSLQFEGMSGYLSFACLKAAWTQVLISIDYRSSSGKDMSMDALLPLALHP